MPIPKISDPRVLAQLAEDHGVIFHNYIPTDVSAMDAQPTLSTTPSAGVLNIFTTYVDPRTIEILFQPMRATQIFDEEKMGDWVTPVAMFPLAEMTGEVSSYGDYNNNGNSNANLNYESRQQYYYQTFSELGEREIAMASKGRFDLVSQVQAASINAINRFQNKSYFYGIAGLKNYGILNDPNLPAAISPSTETVDGTAVTSWEDKTANGVYEDLRLLFADLVTRNQGLVDTMVRGKLCMSPTAEIYLQKTNQFGLNVRDLLEKNFRNVEIVVAPEYDTDSGQLIQFIASDLDGQPTGNVAFSEKLRSHAVVIESSSYKQKRSAGTWGAIIKQPTAIAQLLGV